MLKTHYLFLLLSFCTFSILHAQDSTSSVEIQTLMGSNVKVSGFGGPLMTFGTVANEFMLCTGGGGGVLLNRSLFLGGFGFGSVNDIRINHTSTLDRIEAFGYGGLWLGYNFLADRAIHFGIDTKFGWGSVIYNFEDSSDGVYVVQPGLFAEANITEWFKVNAGLNYRAVAGTNDPYLGNNQLSSPNISLGVLFGWFN